MAPVTFHVSTTALTVRCSCKPQLAHLILVEAGMKEALEGKLVISILAGITMRQLTGWVAPTTRIVRAMPNTPCKVSVLPACRVAHRC